MSASASGTGAEASTSKCTHLNRRARVPITATAYLRPDKRDQAARMGQDDGILRAIQDVSRQIQESDRQTRDEMVRLHARIDDWERRASAMQVEHTSRIGAIEGQVAVGAETASRLQIQIDRLEDDRRWVVRKVLGWLLVAILGGAMIGFGLGGKPLP